MGSGMYAQTPPTVPEIMREGDERTDANLDAIWDYVYNIPNYGVFADGTYGIDKATRASNPNWQEEVKWMFSIENLAANYDMIKPEAKASLGSNSRYIAKEDIDWSADGSTIA